MHGGSLPRVGTAALGLLAVLAAGAARAQVEVDDVVEPAYRERAGRVDALGGGAGIRAGDVLGTGAGGALRLRMGSAALVHLAAETRIRIAGLDAAAQPEAAATDPSQAPPRTTRLLRLDLLAGTIRLLADTETGDAGFLVHAGGLATTLREGAVEIRATPEPVVCLLAGMALAGTAARVTTLREPDSCFGPGFIAAPGVPAEARAASAVPTADPAVAPAPGRVGEAPPRASSGPGEWKVNVHSASTREEGEQVAARVRRAGHTAEVVPAQVRGRQYYRVQIAGIASRDAALELARAIAGRFAPGEPWVNRQ